MAKPKTKGLSARFKAENHESLNSRSYVKIPEGMSLLQLREEGPLRLDVIPFTLSKPNKYNCVPGDLWWEKTFYVHRNVGAEKQTIVCPKSGDPNAQCPICEFIQANRNEWETIKPVMAQERQLFNVIKAGEPDKVYIVNQAYKILGEKIDDKINNAEQDEHFEYFADPGKWTQEDAEDFGDSIVVGTPKGMTMKLTIKPKSLGGNQTFMDVTALDFKPRKYTTQKLLGMAVDLDTILTILSYEKISAMIGGVPTSEPWDEEAEEDESPKKSKSKAKPADDDDDEDDEPAPPKKSKPKGTPVEDDDEDDEPAPPKKSPVKAKPADDDEDDEEDTPPPSKKSKSKAKPVNDDDDDDDNFDSEDEDEDDKPKSTKKSPAKAAKKSDAKAAKAVDNWDDDDDF
jgi:hypothetical protein